MKYTFTCRFVRYRYANNFSFHKGSQQKKYPLLLHFFRHFSSFHKSSLQKSVLYWYKPFQTLFHLFTKSVWQTKSAWEPGSQDPAYSAPGDKLCCFRSRYVTSGADFGSNFKFCSRQRRLCTKIPIFNDSFWRSSLVAQVVIIYSPDQRSMVIDQNKPFDIEIVEQGVTRYCCCFRAEKKPVTSKRTWLGIVMGVKSTFGV